VRRHTRQRAPLPDEEPHLRKVERLQRAQAAVKSLEIVEGSAAAEVALVNDRNR
jgi:hypothetical protein